MSIELERKTAGQQKVVHEALVELLTALDDGRIACGCQRKTAFYNTPRFSGNSGYRSRQRLTVYCLEPVKTGDRSRR